MKITTLKNIKSNKLYKDLSITSVNNKSTTDILKNDCIFVISNSLDTYINILNKNLFKYSYYKYIYSPIRYRNIVKGTYVKINLNEHYKNILSKTEKNRLYKKNLSAYKNYNIIIDMSNQLTSLYDIIKSKSTKSKLELFINNIIENMVSIVTKGYYDNMVFLIPIELSNELNEFGVNKYLNINNLNSDTIQYIYHIFKNDTYLNELKSKLNEKGIKDIAFLFNDTKSNINFKINLSELDKKYELNKTLILIKRLLTFSIKGNISELNIESNEDNSNTEEDTIIDKKIKKTEEVVNDIMSLIKSGKRINPDNINKIPSKDFINSNLTTKETELVNGIINSVTKVINSDSSLVDDDERLINILQNNPEFMEYLKKLKDIQTLGNSNVNTKKIEVLKNTQDSIEVSVGSLKTEDGKPVTLGSILNSNNDITIERTTIPVKDKVLFDNVKENRTKDFDRTYMKTMYDKDILNTFSAFNSDPEIPLFIEKFNVENTSDDLTLKNTYTVQYKDAKGVRHKVVIDIPIIIDDKYIYINGSKKLIQKQLIAKPIIKTAPDKVQITSDYNKYFITRFGQKLSEETDILRKIFTNQDIDKFIINDRNFNFKLGDTSEINLGANISIYYSYLASILFSLHTDLYVIEFDYYKLLNLTEKENNILYDNKLASIATYNKEDYHIIGYTRDKKHLLIVDKGSNKVYLYNNETLLALATNLNQFILNNCIKPNFNEEGLKYLNESSRPKSLVYNRIKISSKNIPLIVVLGYEYGLLNVLDRYKVDYVFSSKNRRSDLMKDMTMKIPFKNGILYYDNKYVRNSLLVSGLTSINTKEYNINEFESKGEAYLDYFQDMFGSRNTAKGISNNISLFLDPKTKDILKRLHLPDNILDLMLYANTLLENNAYNNSNYMGNFRLRGTEQVNAILYKLLADAYKKYKDTSKNGNPIKVSLPQNILLKKIVENQTVDEASDLNPSLEIEKASSVTYKGVGGVNSSDAFNEQFRAYDKSMLGILGMETPDSDKVGIVRTLSYSPAIVNTLGFLDEEADKNGNTNIYTIAELLNNFTAVNADPPRIGMQSTQQKHILSVEDSDKPLFGSGVEKTIPYMLSDVYTFKAKKNGTLTKIDNENNLAILTYEDGTTDVINLNNKVNKNSNGGFFLNSKLELLLKEGETFTQGEILAKDNMYMVGDSKDDISYSIGTRCKVAIAGSDATYEDSSFINSKLSKRMKSRITMKKEMVLGVNTNIEYLVEKGQEIKTGDSLIVFENSFEDKSINQFLDKLGDDFGEMISNMTKNTYRSKYTGRIVDIKIYYNRDIEEFSESVQKILKNYISKNKKLKKLLMENSDTNSLNQINLPTTDKINSPKIKGKEVDGLMIEFYIEYEDYLGAGDKVAYYGSCKTIISDVLDADEEMAFVLNDKGEKVVLDAVFSPLSLLRRMTTDIFKALYTNKLLIGLKENIRDIMES